MSPTDAPVTIRRIRLRAAAVVRSRIESVAFVISGTGSFADEHGNVTQTQPGCRLQAPAGWLHRTLAGTAARILIGTNLPYGEWTMPIDKDPADRPVELAI